MSKKTEVVICLGSSCFARGNKSTLKVIDKFIKGNKLEEQVFFHGGHCFGKCAEGPVVKINNEILTGVDENNVVEILNSHIQEKSYK